jgi:hypothetical protein
MIRRRPSRRQAGAGWQRLHVVEHLHGDRKMRPAPGSARAGEAARDRAASRAERACIACKCRRNAGEQVCAMTLRHRKRVNRTSLVCRKSASHRNDLVANPKGKIYIQIGTDSSAKHRQDVDRFVERSSADSRGTPISCDRSLLAAGLRVHPSTGSRSASWDSNSAMRARSGRRSIQSRPG